MSGSKRARNLLSQVAPSSGFSENSDAAHKLTRVHETLHRAVESNYILRDEKKRLISENNEYRVALSKKRKQAAVLGSRCQELTVSFEMYVNLVRRNISERISRNMDPRVVRSGNEMGRRLTWINVTKAAFAKIFAAYPIEVSENRLNAEIHTVLFYNPVTAHNALKVAPVDDAGSRIWMSPRVKREPGGWYACVNTNGMVCTIVKGFYLPPENGDDAREPFDILFKDGTVVRGDNCRVYRDFNRSDAVKWAPISCVLNCGTGELVVHYNTSYIRIETNVFTH